MLCYRLFSFRALKPSTVHFHPFSAGSRPSCLLRDVIICSVCVYGMLKLHANVSTTKKNNAGTVQSLHNRILFVFKTVSWFLLILGL